MFFRKLFLLALLVSLLSVTPALAQEPGLAEKIQVLAHIAHEGEEAAAQNDIGTMQREYAEIHELWERFEDDVRVQNPVAYIELEGALKTVEQALQTQPLDAAAVGAAYEHLVDEANEIAEKFETGADISTGLVEATPADLLQKLDAASQAIAAGNAAEAAAQLESVMLTWPSVEGTIAVKSPEAYTAIEVELSRAAAALKPEAVNLPAAKTAISSLRTELAPFAVETRYSAFDAAAIILREGLEALLVIVALLAFLNRSGNSDKRRWIWAGVGAGVLFSIGTAFILQAIFSRAVSGQNREIIEGVTGLVAAALLFYVSYWLHNKSSVRAWQKYINTQTTQALAKGSMFGWASLAFLAVFREGAETTILYLGMTSSITVSDLALGLGSGTAILLVVAVLMLKVGLRLPIRPFFQVAGLLVYYLGFKFVGSGIHALQVSGVLPASPVAFLRAIPVIGLYPTWEVVMPQLLLLLLAVTVVVYLRLQDRQSVTVTAP